MTTPKTFSAFTADCMGTSDATELCLRLDKGELSLAEVTEAAIARAEHAAPIIGAIVCRTYEQARRKAQGKGSPSEFRSLPSFLKDNQDFVGTPTSFGSRAMPKGNKAKNSAVTEQLIQVGLNFIGKSTTPPFGFGCSTEFEDDTPPTRNPWSLDHSAGGSSGGSSALVASGVVPIAHANDGGGSIRIPAAMCGVVGFKPSRGRLVAHEKAKTMPIDIISDGVVTRTVRDTAKFYFGAEKVFLPRNLKPIGNVEGASKKRLRVGFLCDSFLTKADDETRQTLLATVKALEAQGHRVEEIPLPASERFAEDFKHYWCLLAFSVDAFGWSVFGREFDRKQLDPLTLGLSGAFKSQFWKTPMVIRRLRKAAAEVAKFTKGLDVVASPVIAKVTPELGWLNPRVPYAELMPRLTSYVGYTPIANATGAPSISLPMGTSKSGLPIGAQFSAAPGEDRMLLELAYELEAIRPWKQLYSK